MSVASCRGRAVQRIAGDLQMILDVLDVGKVGVAEISGSIAAPAISGLRLEHQPAALDHEVRRLERQADLRGHGADDVRGQLFGGLQGQRHVGVGHHVDAHRERGPARGLRQLGELGRQHDAIDGLREKSGAGHQADGERHSQQRKQRQLGPVEDAFACQTEECPELNERLEDGRQEGPLLFHDPIAPLLPARWAGQVVQACPGWNCLQAYYSSMGRDRQACGVHVARSRCCGRARRLLGRTSDEQSSLVTRHASRHAGTAFGASGWFGPKCLSITSGSHRLRLLTVTPAFAAPSLTKYSSALSWP